MFSFPFVCSFLSLVSKTIKSSVLHFSVRIYLFNPIHGGWVASVYRREPVAGQRTWGVCRLHFTPKINAEPNSVRFGLAASGYRGPRRRLTVVRCSGDAALPGPSCSSSFGKAARLTPAATLPPTARWAPPTALSPGMPLLLTAVPPPRPCPPCYSSIAEPPLVRRHKPADMMGDWITSRRPFALPK